MASIYLQNLCSFAIFVIFVISSSRDVLCNAVNVRSAWSKEKFCVIVFGIAMQNSPAAFAALTPWGESSNANASSERSINPSNTERYRSAAGFVRSTSPEQRMHSNRPSSPNRDRCPITQSRDELDARPSFNSKRFASSSTLRTPGKIDSAAINRASCFICSRWIFSLSTGQAKRASN